MKYFSAFFAFMLLATQSFGASFISEIEKIERGQDGEEHLIFLSNGRVGFIKQDEDGLLSAVEMGQLKGEQVEVVLDDHLVVQSLQSIGAAPTKNQSAVSPAEMISFDPTLLSYNSASNMFYRMRRNYQNESQCYNRAHVWAYEEFRKTKIKSMKLFLFFTSRYIRNYRYHWWFHVAPMVYTVENNYKVRRVLDRRYTSGPRYVKNWTDSFVKSGRTCPVVDKYSDYDNHQYAQDCYLIPVSMYFWQPRDIEARDNTGNVKESFIDWEVDHAYWEAF
jgi:hypothetical protein